MTTWILLRGLIRETAHWGDFPDRLSQALPCARFIALDLPGNGVLHEQTSPLTVAAMTQACRHALQAQGVAPPYHLLAMSLGAMVAAEWAQQAPEDVAGCVLINTSLGPFNPFYQRLRPGNYGVLLRLALFERDPAAIETAVWRLTSNQSPPDEATVAKWVDVRAARPVAMRNALRQLLAAARYRAPQRRPVPHMLLLCSEHDRLVHRRCSETIARAWAVPLRMHPAAGHDLPLDDAPWVVEQLGLWLDAGAVEPDEETVGAVTGAPHV